MKASDLVKIVSLKSVLKSNDAIENLSLPGQDGGQRQANPVRVHPAQPALPSQVERDDHDLAVYEGRYRISTVLATQNLSLGVEEQKDIFFSKRLKT